MTTPADRRTDRRLPRTERGTVLIWAMLTAVVIGGLVLASTDTMRALTDVTRIEFVAQGQARSTAEAGVVDALAWFRRQAVQPVTTFAPQRDLAADPPVNETDDPSIGLVREFPIAAGLWGRYEVRPGTPAEPFSDSNGNGIYDAGEAFSDVDGDGRRSPAHDTIDVSAERGVATAGGVWRVFSRGTVFRRPRADLPLGTEPNDAVATASTATEIHRIIVTLPASAAVCARRGSDVHLGDRSRIRSDTTAIACPAGTGTPSIVLGAEVLAPTASAALSTPWNDSIQGVFGVDWSVLSSTADVSTSDPVNGIPGRFPEAALVVVTGDVVFDADRPLRGQGVLVVRGNVRILSSSKSMFGGLLYVDGDLRIEGPSYVTGAILVTGRFDLIGSGGDFAEMGHDPAVLTVLMRSIGQYRLAKPVYLPLPAQADGSADPSALSKGRGRKPAVPPGQAKQGLE